MNLPACSKIRFLASWLFVLGLLLLGSGPLPAFPPAKRVLEKQPAPNPPAEKQSAEKQPSQKPPLSAHAIKKAQEIRRIIKSMQDHAAMLPKKYAKSSDEIKQAAAEFAESLQINIAAETKVAEAYEAGKLSEAYAAEENARQVHKAQQNRRDRLDAFDRHADYVSTEAFQSRQMARVEMAKAENDEYLKALKAAAGAQARLAAALAPNAPPEAGEAARDVADDANEEVTVTKVVWMKAIGYATQSMRARNMGNLDLMGQLEERKRIDDTLIPLLKQQAALKIRLRQLQRQADAALVTVMKLDAALQPDNPPPPAAPKK